MGYPLRDSSAFIKTVIACEARAAAGTDQAPLLPIAAGTGDNTKMTGRTIDRLSGTALCHSAELSTVYNAALTNTKTIAFAHELQESADGTNWDTAEVIEALTVKTTASSSANFSGDVRFAIDLRKRKQYIRFNVTCDMNASGTDTALWSTSAALGGWTQVPQS